jgi:thiol:disulfide interchange protein DsbD
MPHLAAIPVTALALTADVDAFTRALDKGPLYAGLVAFAGGLGSCLTPCVYPMIVITVSVFGARQTSSRAHAMALSTAFVAGIAAMLVPLGVAAGLTGMLFGSQLASPWVSALVAVVLLAFAASMFGAWDMTLPGAVTNRLARMGGAGYWGAFALGMVSGLVAAPCTLPVLGGILIWIGNTRSAVLGAMAMSAFSIGLGLPFWLVGTFAMRIPKSGPWMVAVKTVLGIALAAAALWFVRFSLPLRARPGAAFGVLAVALVVLGLAASTVRAESPRPVVVIRKIVGIVAATLGLVLGTSWWALPSGGIKWQPFSASALSEAVASRRPVLIDFTADWCAECQELANGPLSSDDVVAESQRFARLRVDATDDDDPAVGRTMRAYRVVGLPTLIVIDGTGRESVRITTMVQPAVLLDALRAAR